MSATGKWLVEETNDFIILSGGMLASEKEVFEKAESLLGRTLDHTLRVSTRESYVTSKGERYYYAISTHHKDEPREYGSDDYLKDPQFTSDEPEQWHYLREAHSAQGLDDSPYYEMKHTSSFKRRFRAKMALNIITMLVKIGLTIIIPVLIALTVKTGNALSGMLIGLPFLIAVIMDKSGLSSKLDRMNDNHNPEVSCGVVRGGMVYVIQADVSDNSNRNSRGISKTLSRLLRKLNKIDSSMEIRVENDVSRSFVTVVDDTVGRELPYDSYEFINAYKDRMVKESRLAPVNDSDINVNQKILADRNARLMARIKELQSEIASIECRAMNNHSISSAISKDVDAFVSAGHVDTASYDRMIKNLEDAKDSMLELEKTSKNIDEAVSDLDSVVKLRRQI